MHYRARINLAGFLILLLALTASVYAEDQAAPEPATPAWVTQTDDGVDWDELSDRKPVPPDTPEKRAKREEQRRKDAGSYDEEMYEPGPSKPLPPEVVEDIAEGWDSYKPKPTPPDTEAKRKKRESDRQKETPLEDWMFEPEPSTPVSPEAAQAIAEDVAEGWDSYKPAPTPPDTEAKRKKREADRQKETPLEDWMFEPEPSTPVSPEAAQAIAEDVAEGWDSYKPKPTPPDTPEKRAKREADRQKETPLEDWMFEPEPSTPVSPEAAQAIAEDVAEGWDSYKPAPTPPDTEAKRAKREADRQKETPLEDWMFEPEPSTPVSPEAAQAIAEDIAEGWDSYKPAPVPADTEAKRKKREADRQKETPLEDWMFEPEPATPVSPEAAQAIAEDVAEGWDSYKPAPTPPDTEAKRAKREADRQKETPLEDWMFEPEPSTPVSPEVAEDIAEGWDSYKPPVTGQKREHDVPMSANDAQVYGSGSVPTTSNDADWRRRGRSYPMSAQDAQVYSGALFNNNAQSGNSSSSSGNSGSWRDKVQTVPMSTNDAAVYGGGALGTK